MKTETQNKGIPWKLIEEICPTLCAVALIGAICYDVIQKNKTEPGFAEVGTKIERMDVNANGSYETYVVHKGNYYLLMVNSNGVPFIPDFSRPIAKNLGDKIK